MEEAERDLARLIPHLVAVWRNLRPRGRPGGPRIPDRLSREEMGEVVRGVERLSGGLTRERALAGAPYLDDPRLLGAYLLFYFPLSYLQGRGVFSELGRRPGAVLDLGSGPGPLAFAALDAGARQVLSADRSARALSAARAIAAASGEPLATEALDLSRPGALRRLAGAHRFDTVALGHLVNELFAGEGAAEKRAALLEEAAALLVPGGSLVVVEPALRETSRALLEVRDRLVARGYAVRAPCLYRGPCPARLRATDWCHAERPIEPPPLVAEIARAASLHKEAVKMSYLVLAPPGEGWASPPEGRVFRIVSEPIPSKGRLRYMGCGPEGRMGLALQEKHVAEGNRAFTSLMRGDLVGLEGAEPSGEGLKLGEGSRVTLLARAGDPAPAPRP
ncbi:MAG TPA: small ribosomal subunit Rsm22 family protein [Anaeromyxobacteraceae bacterium]|nr:small ribosomal subunit Rsm22 family protein [Anaeromyxobacteraceae bacterium]